MTTTNRSRKMLVASVMTLLAATTGCSGNSCRVPLTASGCAATFDLQVANSIFPGLCGVAGPCGAFRVWVTPPNYFSQTCVYDSSGEHLLSARGCSDTPICESNQFCQSAGQDINVANLCDLATLAMACPNTDAGAD
jgi:hypothetical protein